MTKKMLITIAIAPLNLLTAVVITNATECCTMNANLLSNLSLINVTKLINNENDDMIPRIRMTR